MATDSFSQGQACSAYRSNQASLYQWLLHCWRFVVLAIGVLRAVIFYCVMGIGRVIDVGRMMGMEAAESSAQPEEALRFAQDYDSEAAQRHLVFKGYLPTRRSLYTDSQGMQQYSDSARMLSAEGAILRPADAQFTQASDILQRHLSAALTDRAAPQQAMCNAANETRALLNRYSVSQS